jgi:hypothetical protein
MTLAKAEIKKVSPPSDLALIVRPSAAFKREGYAQTSCRISHDRSVHYDFDMRLRGLHLSMC